jgi:hypothetical protein
MESYFAHKTKSERERILVLQGFGLASGSVGSQSGVHRTPLTPSRVSLDCVESA